MVSTASAIYRSYSYAPGITCCRAPAHNQSAAAARSPLLSRRQSLVILTACSAGALEARARAQDIPLFGLRRKLEKVEQVAEEIVKEGVESAEREIESVERIAENEVLVLEGGGLGQAGLVLGAEAVAVLVATSVVNGILGPRS